MENIEVEKTYKRLKDGRVEAITKESGKEVFLPVGKDKIKIGVQDQVTTNYIDEKEIMTVMKFLDNQVESAKGHIDSFEVQLKNLDSINEEVMPEELMQKVKSNIDKGVKNKKFREEMKNLNDYLTKAFQKKGIMTALTKMTINLKDADEERLLLRNAI